MGDGGRPFRPEATSRRGAWWPVAALAAELILWAPPARSAAQDEATCDRPQIGLLRYDEDNSFLRDPRCRTDFWDPLKYIELDGSLPAYLTLGIDARERYEYFSPFDWAPGPIGSGGYLIQRLMPFADLRLGKPFQVFVKLTSNLVWGTDPRPLDRDDLDLLQAFASVDFGDMTMRLGRQEIQYADSRLVSVREGPNVRLAFDGVRVMQGIGAWQVDGFALLPVEVRPGIFDDRPQPDERFWGLYSTGPLLGPALGLDVYYLGRYRRDAPFEQGAEDELRHTIGTRIWGESGGADYNLELTWQAGTFGPGTIEAWMVASNVGYTVEALPLQPRFGTQVNANSGDSNPDAPDLQTFNPLFPRGAYFSQANFIGPLNLVDVHPAVTLHLTSALVLTLDWDFFWRQSLGDGLYLPNAVVQVHGAGNPQRYVGSQGALLVQWQATRYASFGGTVSHFFAGAFLHAAGFSDDVTFVALWVNYSI